MPADGVATTMAQRKCRIDVHGAVPGARSTIGGADCEKSQGNHLEGHRVYRRNAMHRRPPQCPLQTQARHAENGTVRCPQSFTPFPDSDTAQRIQNDPSSWVEFGICTGSATRRSLRCRNMSVTKSSASAKARTLNM